MDAFRKQTNFPGGISCGGGDTGFDDSPCRVCIGFYLSPDRLTASAKVPAQIAIVGTGIIPTATEGRFTAPTAGTVTIGVDGEANRYHSGDAFEVDAETSPSNTETLAAETEIIFTADGALDGDVYVYVEVIPLGRRI